MMVNLSESSYLLTKYVTSYGTKGEKSTIDLTDIALDRSLCSRLWTIALRGINHRECGAIEAADTLLGHLLHGTDPDTIFRWVDVSFNRKRKLKPVNEVKKLPENSTDIFCELLVDTHYPNRPKELHSLSLYDFAKWYDVWKKNQYIKRNFTKWKIIYIVEKEKSLI